MRLPWSRSVLLLVLLYAATLGCRRTEDATSPQPIVDLAATFPFTERRPPTERIDFGDPRSAVLLGGGWTAPETLEDGKAIRRNDAPLARVWFDGGNDPAPTRIALHAWLEVPPDLPVQVRVRLGEVRVRLNDAYVTSVRLSPERGPRTFEVPRELLRPGRNELLLRHVGALGPQARPTGRGARFVYEAITFEPLALRPVAPRPAGDGSRLVLPPGAAAPFFFRVPRGAELRLTVEPANAAAALGLTLEGEGTPSRRLALRGDGERRATLKLPGGGIGKLVLEAPAQGPEVTLVGPTVWGEAPPPPPARDPAATPAWRDANVLLYVVDTLRADRLGCYGHAEGLSPAIDRLARDGVVFEQAVAQSSWTRPATASILTGQYPIRHGAITLENAIAPDVPSLAELLHAAGLRTAGFVTNVNVADRYGFGRGFDVYRHLPEMASRPGLHVPAGELHAEFLRWLDDHPGERFFAYLHATDPHGPYTPKAETIRRFGTLSDAETTSDRVRAGELPRANDRMSPTDTEYLRGLYEAEIAELDAAIGLLVGELDRRGLFERTIVVLVADHGEEFAEHGGFGHGRTLFREQLHVPLVVRLPGRAAAGTRVARLARQVDVLPTILTLLGLEPPTSGAGVPLLDPTGEPTASDTVETVAETRLAGGGSAALITADWKAIMRQGTGAIAVFDRRRDPDEQQDRATQHPLRVGYARQRLLQLTAAAAPEPTPATSAPPLDHETMERLEALGYLH